MSDKQNQIDVENTDDLELLLFNKKPEWVMAMENTLDWFKKEVKKGSRGLKTGFDELDKALLGLQTGFHVFGAASNAGKTAFMGQIALNIATLNKNTYVLDISLDDPLREKLARVVAAHHRTLVNAVKDPKMFEKQYPGMIKRVEKAIEDMKKLAWNYRAVDATEWGTDVEDIADEIRELCVKLKSMSTPYRLAVFIDNFHDLTTNSLTGAVNDKNKYDHIAKIISELANELDIPIMCTAEFRKLNNYRRPTRDDIRESTKIAYLAKSILLGYNEVGLKGENAAVYYMRRKEPLKQPVFEIKVDKNKYSSFKGRLFYEFYPDMAHFIEASHQDSMRYAQAVYNSE